MEASVSVLDADDRRPASRLRLVLLSTPSSGLELDIPLGTGISIGFDVTGPESWRWVEIGLPWAPDDEPLLRALIGEPSTEALRSVLERTDGDAAARSSWPATLPVDLAHARPWLRLAAAETLDHWLYLPLNQDLVDTERAVARSQAALTLAEGSAARSAVFSDALRLARGAAAGLTGYLGQLSSSRQVVPAGLKLALEELMKGYGRLRGQVDGEAGELQAALEGWAKLSAAMAGKGRSARGSRPGRAVRGADPRAGREFREDEPGSDLDDESIGSLIDPRQVPARRVRLAGDPRRAEVTMAQASLAGREAVLVQVPAYRDDPGPGGDHLLVRLIERGSGQQRSHALLTRSHESAGHRPGDPDAVFQTMVPLRGSRLSELRADIYDATSTLPPATADSDRDLQQARRATMFLREWRRLVAAAQLPTEAVRPAAHLRTLARRLQPVNDEPHPETPFFSGGPSATDLEQWSDLGDDHLLAGMRHDDPDPNGASAGGGPADPDDEQVGAFALTRGPARLLLAELAAAFASS